jgi:hypothetical protein
MRDIETKYRDGGSARWSLADNQGSVPGKVAIPSLATRIEEPNDFARLHVSTAQIALFE